ncbi:hypothetical protein DMB66_11590 [Actinoplanes sp. ATCC 53533]|uniref:hypothetical protein n=1 Tax=Actinoplanes sp. ATCC 53533 TaxID=1288362 RepID=UPI000F7AB7C6|nr:hypothetical protein [Actinoplanes sp. ATCC 53533]RSM69163.1 hypothetical protein DMB66_11590 [Actinoplanes sp. ATCC 53533]
MKTEVTVAIASALIAALAVTVATWQVLVARMQARVQEGAVRSAETRASEERERRKRALVADCVDNGRELERALLGYFGAALQRSPLVLTPVAAMLAGVAYWAMRTESEVDIDDVLFRPIGKLGKDLFPGGREELDRLHRRYQDARLRCGDLIKGTATEVAFSALDGTFEALLEQRDTILFRKKHRGEMKASLDSISPALIEIQKSMGVG